MEQVTFEYFPDSEYLYFDGYLNMNAALSNGVRERRKHHLREGEGGNMNNIYTRVSVRQYEDRAVEPEKITDFFKKLGYTLYCTLEDMSIKEAFV